MKIYNRFTKELIIEVKGIKKDLGGADLGGAYLGGAYLGGANLYRANLGGADLRRANLYRADLRRANLYRADLRGANLEGAYLEGAYLYRADLERTDLSNTCVKTFTLGRHYGFIHENTVKIGCRSFLMEDVNRVMLRKLGKENDYSKEEIKLYSNVIMAIINN